MPERDWIDSLAAELGSALLLRALEALEVRDSQTIRHSRRCSELAVAVGRELGCDEVVRKRLRFSAALHDLGKAAIDADILGKPAPLTPAERALVREPPALGGEMLAGLASPLARHAARAVRHHHERWDGSGYPDGLAGRSIPWMARVISVVDAWDVISRGRVYLAGSPPQPALEAMAAERCAQFDPEVLDALFAVVGRPARRPGPLNGVSASGPGVRPQASDWTAATS